MITFDGSLSEFVAALVAGGVIGAVVSVGVILVGVKLASRRM